MAALGAACAMQTSRTDIPHVYLVGTAMHALRSHRHASLGPAAIYLA